MKPSRIISRRGRRGSFLLKQNDAYNNTRRVVVSAQQPFKRIALKTTSQAHYRTIGAHARA